MTDRYSHLGRVERLVTQIVESRGMTHEVKRAKLLKLMQERYEDGWRDAMRQENAPGDAAQCVEP